METETDIATNKAGTPPETSRPKPTELMQLWGALSLLTWTLLIFAGLFVGTGPRLEINMYVSYSLTTIAGFYLACGNARWWVRWLLLGLAVLLIIFAHFNPDKYEGIAYFSIMGMISAGFTYLGRMIISAFRRESSPKQRFTIFGLMLATAITAVCMVALNHLVDSDGGPPVTLIIVVLILLGFMLTAQCAPLWTRTKWEALAFAVSGLLLAIPAGALIYVILHYFDNGRQAVDEIFFPISMMTFFVWLTLYPLWFGFYALGWTLIDPSWKLGPRYESKSPAKLEREDIDVLMED